MTDADTGAALLAAILANPDEDTPRLVYADWLEENDRGPHARFIRRQVAGEVAPLPLTALLTVEGLLGCQPHQCQRGAEAGVAFAVSPGRATVWFRRGFAEWVECTGEAWERHGDEVCAAHPIRRVNFLGETPSVELVGSSPRDRRYYCRVAGSVVPVSVAAIRVAEGPELPGVIFSARWRCVPPNQWGLGLYSDGLVYTLIELLGRRRSPLHA